MALARLCGTDDLADGEMRQVVVEGLGTLAVYRVGDAFFATDDACTHAHSSLADEGYLEGYRITCTWHDGAFDVRTGEVLAPPCPRPLKTYPVQVRDGGVFVEG